MTQYRSWLLVPGDDEDALAGTAAVGADVVVIDLEEGVAPVNKAGARRNAAEWLAIHRHAIVEHRRMSRWVRINALETRMWRDDLAVAMAGAPDGIVLPKSTGPDSVRQVAAEIYELEQRNQIPNGATRVLAMAGEKPRAALSVTTYLDAPHQRLAGLGWTAGGLAHAIGATRARDGEGWSDPFRHLRAQVLLTAHACGIMAVEAPHPEPKGFAAAAAAARADGFTGMFATAPQQVAAINAAFAPTEEDIEQARRIVRAFADSFGAVTVEIDGRTVDHAQLQMARRLLGMDEAGGMRPAGRAPILRSA